jgi:hypothetical protein
MPINADSDSFIGRGDKEKPTITAVGLAQIM